MADQITRVDYYVGTIPDKIGEGARFLNAIKDAGINLTGFLGYRKTARNAEIVVVVDEKAPALGGIAKKAGVTLEKKQKGFFINGEDRPGAVAEIMAKLAEAGINVVSTHAMCGGANRWGALITVAAPEVRKAATVLGL